MAGWRSLGHLIILTTVIWLLFIIVSAALGILITTSLEVDGVIPRLSRVAAGLIIFTAWVLAWERLVEVWLYRIMLGRQAE